MKIVFILTSENVMSENPQILYKNFYSAARRMHVNICFESMDLNKEYGEDDWFVFKNFYSWHVKYYLRIRQQGLLSHAIYLMSEPDVVMPHNSEWGMKWLKKFFSNICTYRTDFVDNDRIFFQSFITIVPESSDGRTFIRSVFCDKLACDSYDGEKRFMINISGNKLSNISGELYSERKRVIEFFNKYFPEQFDLYGPGWEQEKYCVYKGFCDDKLEEYRKHKFALCLENTSLPGYLTEKIFDCFCGRVVPIYKGASDIENFIPKNCYINYADFSSLLDLKKYCDALSDEAIETIIENGQRFLHSREAEMFWPDRFIRVISDIVCQGYCSFDVKRKDLLLGYIYFVIMPILRGRVSTLYHFLKRICCKKQ